MSARRLLLALLLLPGLALGQDMVVRDGVTLTPAQEKRAEAVGDQLRCLVCQNESIEASSAKLAHQLRVIIRQQVVQGVPNKQIMNYMVQRYGIFVLLKPPISPLTWLLYASPFIALILGFFAVWFGRRARQPATAPLSQAEQARLDELLK
ncbi:MULTISPECIES: cytochrome c-type biogenesis protein [Acidocella]|uniref:cytochrome c-type biogenesis protein n=1 Tax=Acidocella TaxID=50709 RepID=UPI00028D7984|nr:MULTISPECIES: cytochrome c-type biogenesis protein [Acidocella]EKN00462.1 cytochrome c-type biogenesis protein CcmH [Acidocella sp. MX-AZ02]WBO60011.1 cytochrome c-type biogenesis protein CcmH [Acidocella sp. MX-AZ03]